MKIKGELLGYRGRKKKIKCCFYQLMMPNQVNDNYLEVNNDFCSQKSIPPMPSN